MILHGLWTRVDAVKELADELDQTIERRLATIESEMQGLSDVEDDDYRDHLSAVMSDKHDQISIEWRRLARESLLLAICSSFEHSLTRLTDQFAARQGSVFKVSDINGRGISRCRVVLQRLGMPSSAFGSSWSRLEDVYEVRNRFAHSGGVTDTSLQNRLQRLSGIAGLTDDEPQRIYLTTEALSLVCDLITDAARAINRAFAELNPAP
jgi:hypothetical protein